MPEYGLAIHGGAGAIARERMGPGLETRIREGLSAAIEAGYRVLEAGGRATDAVEAAVVSMEDSPLFNAGKGAVFTHDGLHEQDATVMDGATLEAGAVAAVRTIRNPIRAAHEVLRHSPHVLLAGEGAEAFARARGLETAAAEYFFTERRWRQLDRVRSRERALARESSELSEDGAEDDTKHGTVGAVALDRAGNLAAATSSGGMTNKRWGRVGDSALVGAGTYANNATCAVSTTGHGEYFMRAVTAYDLSVLMEHKRLSVEDAAACVIMDKLAALGGTGGLVAIDRGGRIAMPFNTRGMHRGYRLAGGAAEVGIFEA